MSDLIGHSQAADLLRRLHLSGRLGQAMLIVGAPGVGKRRIAEALIGDSPDFLVLERQRNDNDGLKKNISIEQVQDLIQRLSLKTFSGGQNVGLIDGAEFLSDSAANALLKTLEEPPGKSLIILLATSLAGIPATIISRCQMVRLSLVAFQEICDALVARGASPETANEIAQFAAGRPGVALRLLQDPEVYRSYESHRSYLDVLLTAALPARLGLLAGVAQQPAEDLQAQMDVWELELYAQKNYPLLKRLLRARSAMRQNVGAILALEHAFI